MQIVMLQSSMLMGGRSDGLDRYRDLRLDVDHMSYEVNLISLCIVLCNNRIFIVKIIKLVSEYRNCSTLVTELGMLVLD